MDRNGAEPNTRADIRSAIKQHLVTLGFSAGIFMVIFCLIVILANNSKELPVQAQPEDSTEIATDHELAKLIILSGTPRTKMDAHDFQDGFEGQLLFSGMKVRTDDKSQALIVFDAKNSLSLDVSTLVSFEKTPLGEIVITLESGRVWHRFPVDTNDNFKTAAVFAESEFTKGSLLLQQDSNTYVHAVKEDIEIKALGQFDEDLAEGEETYVSESSRVKFTTGTEDTLITEFSGERDEWYKFNQCLDIVMPDLVRFSTGLENIYTVVKQRVHNLNDCEEILGLATVKPDTTGFNLPILYPKPRTGSPANLTSLTAAFDTNGQLLCNWSATGSVTGYDYSVWEKLNDGTFVLVKDWASTSNQSANAGTGTDLGLVNGKTYICRVKANSYYGNNQKDTNAVIYDTSTGTLSVNNPAPNYQAQVDGTGQFLDANFADLHVRFKILNNDPTSVNNGMFCNDNNTWTTTETWFNATLTELQSGTFKFENFDVTCGDPDKSGIFTIELRNTLSDKLLNSLEFPILLTIAP